MLTRMVGRLLAAVLVPVAGVLARAIHGWDD
jgi:hypothetical protein